MAASPYFAKMPQHWSLEVINEKSSSVSNPPLRIWKNPNGQTGRALFIVHGWGEQSGRYEHFSHYLQFCVDAIAAVDLPGHGLFSGQKGHFEKIEDIVEAARHGFLLFEKHLSQEAQKNNSKKKPQMYWMGHSFGGLTTLHVLKKYQALLPVRKYIVSAPLLEISLPVPAVKELFGKLITPLLPKLVLTQEIDGSTLSKDPVVGETYKSDPLNHSSITPRAYQQMTQAMQTARDWLGPIAVETLFIIPMQDRVVSAPANIRFTQKLRVSQDTRDLSKSLKKVTYWPGVYHESFNDIEKNLIFNLIESWISDKS